MGELWEVYCQSGPSDPELYPLYPHQLTQSLSTGILRCECEHSPVTCTAKVDGRRFRVFKGKLTLQSMLMYIFGGVECAIF